VQKAGSGTREREGEMGESRKTDRKRKLKTWRDKGEIINDACRENHKFRLRVLDARPSRVSLTRFRILLDYILRADVSFTRNEDVEGEVAGERYEKEREKGEKGEERRRKPRKRARDDD